MSGVTSTQNVLGQHPGVIEPGRLWAHGRGDAGGNPVGVGIPTPSIF